MLLCSTVPGPVESDENGTALNCPKKKKLSLKTSFPDPSLPPSLLPHPLPGYTIKDLVFCCDGGGLLQVWAEECEPGGGVVMGEGVGMCRGAWKARAWRHTVVEVEG